MFTVEQPFNSQNDRVYAPVDNKKRYINPSRLLVCYACRLWRPFSGVTTRGEVRQLPQGAKWQGALWADGLFSFTYCWISKDNSKLPLLKMTFSVSLSALKSIKDFAEFIFITRSEIRIIFQLSGSYNHCLFALSDTSWDSFQRWKKFFLINTFLRSILSQVRLSSLAILSIKSRCLEDVDTDKIIDSFADNKACKKSF